MLFAELRENLKTKVAPAYTMTGSDIFLVNKAIDLILTATGTNDLNVVRFDDDVTDDQINAALSNVSMFGGKTAVVVRGVGDARVILEKCAKKDIVPVDCNPMAEALVVRLITQNKKFSPDIATILARACENNFSRVNGEMQKLDAYCDGAVTAEAVDAIVTKTEKYQVYELGNALLKKDATKARTILENLLSGDVDEYAVFGSLVSFAKRLFYIANAKVGDGDLAKHLGVHPYAVISTRRDGRWVTSDFATKLYQTALDYEYQIKSGRLPINRATILLVGELL